jgi:hypothetical protein
VSKFVASVVKDAVTSMSAVMAKQHPCLCQRTRIQLFAYTNVRCQGTADITTGIEQGCATELRADTSVELALPRCGPQVPWVS